MRTPTSLFFDFFIRPGVDRRREAALAKIRARGTARVCLIASSLSMWRLEGVWALMQRDSRFDCRILLIPLAKHSPETRAAEMQKLRDYFGKKGIAYHEEDFFEEFDPDIVFYQQFYSHSYLDPVRACHNEHRLLCYTPYGVMFIDKKWQYNSRFHNVGWKIYMQSEAHRNTSRRLADNRGSNVVVVGDADSDAFAEPGFEDVWKPQEHAKKRIIWAPHHKKLKRDSFEWTAAAMKEMALKYRDSVQFAFKPHPILKTYLYRDPAWGQEKTDEFWHFWESQPNTQLETGAFIDLFKGSDAMIHDCNSFIAEYMYTGKPALFLSGNTDRIRASFGEFGKAAIDAHYHGDKAESIPAFIDKVVLGGEDELAPVRKDFADRYLRNGTVPGSAGGFGTDSTRSIYSGFAAGIVHDIASSIWPD